MADENLDSPSFGTFGIEDTMEYAGNAELIKDLLAPETSTGDPNKIVPIEKEETKKEEEPKKEETKKNENVIHDFLGGEEEEEEAEEKPKQSPIVPEEKKEEEHEEINQFSALSKDLFKLGVFVADEEEGEPEITTAEDFLDRFNSEKKKGAIEIVNNFISQFGDDYQKAFDAIYVKGVNPKDYFGVYNEIVNIAEVDLTKEDNQIAVIKRALFDQGYEEEDVNTEIERLKNYGDLETVATKHHKVLVKKEAMKLQEMEKTAETERQQRLAIKNQYIKNVQTVLQEKLKSKEFDGIPINPKLAAELQDFLLVDKYKTASGELLTEFDKAILELKRPENHEFKVKVALLLKVLEKDPTLSTIQRSGVSKKTDALFGEVARLTSDNKKENISQNKQSSWFK